jgi:hypothetical protein
MHGHDVHASYVGAERWYVDLVYTNAVLLRQVPNERLVVVGHARAFDQVTRGELDAFAKRVELTELLCQRALARKTEGHAIQYPLRSMIASPTSRQPD